MSPHSHSTGIKSSFIAPISPSIVSIVHILLSILHVRVSHHSSGHLVHLVGGVGLFHRNTRCEGLCLSVWGEGDRFRLDWDNFLNIIIIMLVAGRGSSLGWRGSRAWTLGWGWWWLRFIRDFPDIGFS